MEAAREYDRPSREELMAALEKLSKLNDKQLEWAIAQMRRLGFGQSV